MWKFGKRSEAVLNQYSLDPNLVRIARLALELSPFDFGFSQTSGVRTPEMQNDLFQEGKSKCNGYTTLSKHQEGLALDFYGYDSTGAVDGTTERGRYVMTMIALSFLEAAHRLGYRLRSGAFFKGYGEYGDLGHVELISE